MSTTTQGKAIILRFAGSGDNPGIVVSDYAEKLRPQGGDDSARPNRICSRRRVRRLSEAKWWCSFAGYPISEVMPMNQPLTRYLPSHCRLRQDLHAYYSSFRWAALAVEAMKIWQRRWAVLERLRLEYWAIFEDADWSHPDAAHS